MLRPMDYTSGFPKPFLFDYKPPPQGFVPLHVLRALHCKPLIRMVFVSIRASSWQKRRRMAFAALAALRGQINRVYSLLFALLIQRPFHVYPHECSLNQKCEHQTGHPTKLSIAIDCISSAYSVSDFRLPLWLAPCNCLLQK